MADQPLRKMAGVGVRKGDDETWHAYAAVDGEVIYQGDPYPTELEAEEEIDALHERLIEELQKLGFEPQLTMLQGGAKP